RDVVGSAFARSRDSTRAIGRPHIYVSKVERLAAGKVAGSVRIRRATFGPEVLRIRDLRGPGSIAKLLEGSFPREVDSLRQPFALTDREGTVLIRAPPAVWPKPRARVPSRP